MFTGIIEELGIITNIKKYSSIIKLFIKADKVLEDIKNGSSICVNGVCLTVVDIREKIFSVEVVKESVRKTNLGALRVNSKVNIERALRVSDRLDGHFVLGHIDTTAKVTSVKKSKQDIMFTFFPPLWTMRYIAYKGSIAIDGVSLTVADRSKSKFSVAIIPYTMKNTNFCDKKVGNIVNIELDILAKYLEIQHSKFKT